MRTYSSRRWRSGLSLTELVVLVAVMGIVAMIFLPYIAQQRRPQHGKSPRIKCIYNLKNVGLAFRIFATDNNDLFPPQVMVSNGVAQSQIDAMNVFRWLSNELSTPKILSCPADAKREAADLKVNFDTMAAKNISYFASLTANETNPQAFLAGDRNLMTNGKAVGPGILELTTNSGVSWSKEIHVEQGNIAMADGSVQQMSSARLRIDVGQQDLATNYLVFP